MNPVLLRTYLTALSQRAGTSSARDYALGVLTERVRQKESGWPVSEATQAASVVPTANPTTGACWSASTKLRTPSTTSQPTGPGQRAMSYDDCLTSWAFTATGARSREVGRRCLSSDRQRRMLRQVSLSRDPSKTILVTLYERKSPIIRSTRRSATPQKRRLWAADAELYILG